MSETVERLNISSDELVASLRNDSLQLILLPTEQCNFRCTYCYEDFVVGRMSPATVQGIKRLIDRRLDGLRLLSVSWFGGEPLLARWIVEDISEHIVHAVSGRPNLNYIGDMTTNGYLLDASVLARLAELRIHSYQVSLDGPEEIHDRTRVRADGKGSFSRIWRNLLTIRDSATPIHITLRIHLTPSNVSSMPDFLSRIRDTFLLDKRFTVLLKPVERLGGPNDATMNVLSVEERRQAVARLEQIVLDGGGRDRLFHAPEICYAARPNSLMIRANGIVGKCTVALTDPANAIGQLRPDGTLQINNPRLRPWLRGWESGNPDTLACPYIGLPGQRAQLLQIGQRAVDLTD